MSFAWRHFDWNVRNCGWHGHITYRPTEQELADRLHVETAAGDAWRCLRCGAFVVGAPHGSGPADHAPLVLRGKALRDAFILRLLAVERFVRGLLVLALAYGVYKFNDSKTALTQVFQTYLPLFKPIGDHLGIDLQDAGPVRLIDKLLHTPGSTLRMVALGVAAYGALQLLEGLGLWLLKRWGEYVAVVGTSLFIPLEIYELVERVTWLRIAALLVNLAAVVYILWTKRLFGIRGGHEAFEAERHEESLLEIERAAVTADAGSAGHHRVRQR